MAGPPNTTADPERDEVVALLPWYAAGTLSRDEHARVERYVAEHKDLERLVALAREEHAETVAGNEALGGPSQFALDRLLARVATEDARWPAARPAKASLIARLGEWIADLVQGLSPPQLAMVAASALALFVAQGVTIGVMMGARDGGGYETASGGAERPAEIGTFALVAFAPGASAASIGELLTELGAAIVDGPKAGGIYRLRLASEPLEEAAAKAKLERLSARGDLVTFASLTR